MPTTSSFFAGAAVAYASGDAGEHGGGQGESAEGATHADLQKGSTGDIEAYECEHRLWP
jgi:hypothetical protein